jgi:aspartyl-tRNA(Asn)/glutamyl-tRNA(Gln) amidotransferase subunit C
MANMAIELKDVEHLAGLARIAVSQDEKKVLQHDLEEILDYVSQIKEVTAEMGEPEAGEFRNVMRDDIDPYEVGAFTEDILNEVPKREGNKIFVKKIL